MGGLEPWSALAQPEESEQQSASERIHMVQAFGRLGCHHANGGQGRLSNLKSVGAGCSFAFLA